MSEIRAGIRVCARFRPQNKLEKKQQAVECVRIDENTTVQVDNSGKSGADSLTFTFDQVFGTTSTQKQVYEATAKPLVDAALRGYNCTCFVYGQTGTGKTFSMEGVPGDPEYAGIIPRVMDDIFQGIQSMQSELEFLVRVSYIEIYLEKIRDLLEPNSRNLNVRESKDRGVWIQGATEVCCASSDDMMAVMRLGGTNRVISSTRMNSDSSRSHSVFIITIEQRNMTTNSTKSGKLFLVDLAGSEKVGKTMAQGQTLKEAQHINKSLSALGSVMNALTSTDQQQQHIPYRDSKLTRLLQDALGGNSETTLLVCASCSSYNAEETISTLRFGARAKSIKNKPKINEERTVAEYKLLLLERETEIRRLKDQLGDTAGTMTTKCMDPVEKQQVLDKIEQLEDEKASQQAEITSLEARCEELEAQVQAAADAEALQLQNKELLHQVAFLEDECKRKDDQYQQLQAALATSASKCSMDAIWKQEMHAKLLEINRWSTRIKEMTDELAHCRRFYERKIDLLQDKLREYDTHVRAFMAIADHDDQTHQLDSLAQKTKMLRAVRGGNGNGNGNGNTAVRTNSVVDTSSNESVDGWCLDATVYPIAPIDLDSPVIKRLLQQMPLKGRDAMVQWMSFVLEGRDIRSQFHPEMTIEGLTEPVNDEMRRLMVPLLQNRLDLQVQAFTRTRFVKVSDLKLSVTHRHPPSTSENPTEPVVSAQDQCKDHVFYGPKSDPSSPLVLHGLRVLHATKDRFVSEPVGGFSDLKSMVDQSESPTAAPSSMLGRLRSSTKSSALLGNMKQLVTSQYHKYKYYVHDATRCSGCDSSPIVGGKWTCSVCNDLELCDTCYGMGMHGLERSHSMCRRLEQLLVQKHRVLNEFPEVLEIFRTQYCHDDVAKFRDVLEWLSELVSGSPKAEKVLVLTHLHPDVRGKLVTQLAALASERPQVVLKTEWVVDDQEDGVTYETLRIQVTTTTVTRAVGRLSDAECGKSTSR